MVTIRTTLVQRNKRDHPWTQASASLARNRPTQRGAPGGDVVRTELEINVVPLVRFARRIVTNKTSDAETTNK